MVGRAVLVWFGIMVVAILNGAFRDVVLMPRMGDPIARAVSCVTLAAAIFAVTWLALPWIRPQSAGDAWRIGALWLVMTLVFEFGAGHYLFRTPWPQLLADCNLAAGRLWILVLAATLMAPVIVYGTAENPAHATEISAAARDDTPER